VSVEKIELLLLVAAIIALVAKRLRLPYTVGLVIGGALLAWLGPLKNLELTKEMIFRGLLPPLIFEAAFFVHWKELRKDLKPVLLLATFGVILSCAFVGFVMSWLVGWPLWTSLLFGSLIVATDPVAVIAMFKEMKVEGRLRLLVEAESLLNDGVAAVLFSIALVVATGSPLSAGGAVQILLREVIGGIGSGALVASAVLYLAGKTEDHLVEITFTTIAAYGSFFLADHFHCSGVLAVLTAGLMIGNLGHIGAITDNGHKAVGAFWEFAAFVANSVIFILIGVRELGMIDVLSKNISVIMVAIAVCLISRAIGVYSASYLIRFKTGAIERPHQHVLFWGGLKGALSLALALGLPTSLPLREPIIAATFGVVGFSVILQGLTVPSLLRRLQLIG